MAADTGYRIFRRPQISFFVIGFVDSRVWDWEIVGLWVCGSVGCEFVVSWVRVLCVWVSGLEKFVGLRFCVCWRACLCLRAVCFCVVV